jgi:hypothetical protein
MDLLENLNGLFVMQSEQSSDWCRWLEIGYTKNVRLVEKVDNIIEISQIQSKISFHLKQ